MKQNERLLVYVVTGFLALILVVAVVFSRDPGQGNASTGKSMGLDQLMGDDPAKAGDKGGKAGDLGAVPTPGEVAPVPLSAAPPKSMVAADIVAQQLGVSRREHTVRMVRVKQGDSLEGLVRRWCGARDPYLDEAKALNETLVTLKVGTEIAVPWVDDEALVAAIEAAKPKLLTAENAVAGGASGTNGGVPSNASASPSFSQPGGQPDAGTSDKDDKVAKNPAGGGNGTKGTIGSTSYTVKDGDSLWRIAARTYGAKNADRMVKAIKAANTGLTDAVRAGQKITLPADS